MSKDEAREDAKTAAADIEQLETRISELQDGLLQKTEQHLNEILHTAMKTREIMQEINKLRSMRGSNL